MKMRFITPAEAIDCPRFIKDFAAKGAVSATLEITGLGLYRAEINGVRVGADYLTPGFNDYDAYLRYQTYDVTGLLQAENRLTVTLGRGWAMSRLGPNSGDPCHWGRRYLLAARLTLTFADERVETAETDESWVAMRSPITMSELYDGEHRDETREPGVPVPCVEAETDYRLEAPVSPPIRQVGQLRPRLIVTPKGERVLDFGQNFAGIIRFVNRLPRGGSLLLQTGEVLQQGCFYRDNLNTALSEYRYTSDGVCKIVEPMFCYYGFRYARITCDGPVDPADFTGVVLSSDLRPTLQCETDHPQLNRLTQNALWSQRSNFLDVPTDCPQRDERLGWLGDAQVFAATACYQLDCKDFYRKFIRDMREEQTRYYAGDLPMYVPSLKGEAGPGGAVWSDAATIIPWQIYWAYGDKDLLRESYPLMRDYTETLIRADQRLGGGHIRFDAFTFGDWLAQDGVTDQSVFGGTEHAFIQGVYYMQSAALTARAAQALGEQADAERYGGLAADIRRALIDEYITPGGRLALDTQTAYVLALRHGLGADKVKDGLRDRLRRDGFHIRCGFTGAPLMIGALLDAGMTDEAYRILCSPDFPGWLYEINLGATTIWERWNSLDAQGVVTDTGMNSFNHYAYGAVCEAIYSRIMGLQCAAPGWKKARIAPRIRGYLRRSHIRYASAAGVYQVDWRITDDGGVVIDLQVPQGGSAEVVLPDHPEPFAQTLGPGAYRYAYQPTRDYLRPFDGHSLILDLIRCPAAARLLQEKAPALWAKAADPASDVRAKRLDELSWGVPRKAREEAKRIVEELKGVRAF